MNARRDQDPESVVRDIRRNTRRKFSSEEKIRIVLEGLKGEACRIVLLTLVGQVLRIRDSPHNENSVDSTFIITYSSRSKVVVVR